MPLAEEKLLERARSAGRKAARDGKDLDACPPVCEFDNIKGYGNGTWAAYCVNYQDEQAKNEKGEPCHSTSSKPKTAES